MDKSPPANAEGHKFDPWSGKIPHAAGQLRLCATTAQPIRRNLLSLGAATTEALEPVLCAKISPATRSPCTPTKSSPHSPLDKAHVQQRRPSATKKTLPIQIKVLWYLWQGDPT